MSVRDGGECNGESAVMSGGGGVCMDSGGVSESKNVRELSSLIFLVRGIVERDCWEGLVRGILRSSQSSRYTILVFFNPVTPSQITTSGIPKSTEVRFTIVWSNLNHFFVHQPVMMNSMRLEPPSPPSHPTFTAPPVRSTFGIRSEVCGKAFLRK